MIHDENEKKMPVGQGMDGLGPTITGDSCQAS